MNTVTAELAVGHYAKGDTCAVDYSTLEAVAGPAAGLDGFLMAAPALPGPALTAADRG